MLTRVIEPIFDVATRASRFYVFCFLEPKNGNFSEKCVRTPNILTTILAFSNFKMLDLYSFLYQGRWTKMIILINNWWQRWSSAILNNKNACVGGYEMAWSLKLFRSIIQPMKRCHFGILKFQNAWSGLISLPGEVNKNDNFDE